ncbi:MAG: hypothetical protein HY690_16685 [Chloroflexi bacterium]|nr:hypothetical protein [Chloroflexota bacterium]
MAGATPPNPVQGEHFVDGSGQTVFLLGANYEGPADRAWQMWDEGKFDPNLVARDLDRARAANVSVLRVFVQRALAEDIRAGRWTKLDRVLDLADQRGLKLVLTFADYAEPELVRLVAIDSAVAARYRSRPTVFAYDLKNEPRFGDLALAIYPPGLNAALQRATLVAAVGETLARPDVAGYRASEQGQADLPKRLTDDQAYVYANVLAAYRRLLQDAQAWAKAHNSTVVRYLQSPDSAAWNPLKEALNATLAAWLKPRLDALRAADPGRPITVGHVDPLLASLPVNAWLDYRTTHRYPSASSQGLEAAMALFDDLRAAVPGKPLVLGEFGFSNAGVDEQRSGALEADLVRLVRDHGGAGALKWMLNDYPNGFNPRENAFGMYRPDGSAKPVVAAFQALGVLCPVPGGLRPGEPRPLDYDLPAGHFFTQANGKPPGTDPCGYTITNAEGIAFWDAFQRLGGVPVLGYPVARRFLLQGFVVQPMQKAIFQWRPAERQVWLLNTFDWLHDAGKDGWLQAARQTPAPFDTRPDAGQPWEQVLARHVALLDSNPALKARFLAEADWINRFGLPMSVADYPNLSVVRAQRAVLQQWKSDLPWARAGEITLANGGDLAKEAGLIPAYAVPPEPPP